MNETYDNCIQIPFKNHYFAGNSSDVTKIYEYTHFV